MTSLEMTQRFLSAKGIMILALLAPLALGGCASVSGTNSSKVCPNAIILTAEEEQKLIDCCPDLYIRFSNQQFDLLEL